MAQAFEVSIEGQQGAALQAQEPLCTWLKLATPTQGWAKEYECKKNLENV